MINKVLTSIKHQKEKWSKKEEEIKSAISVIQKYNEDQ